jgi:hypothetical protein
MLHKMCVSIFIQSHLAYLGFAEHDTKCPEVNDGAPPTNDPSTKCLFPIFICHYIADLCFQDMIKSSQLSMDECIGKVTQQLGSDVQLRHAQDVHLASLALTNNS